MKSKLKLRSKPSIKIQNEFAPQALVKTTEKNQKGSRCSLHHKCPKKPASEKRERESERKSMAIIQKFGAKIECMQIELFERRSAISLVIFWRR